jgi:hypothetical protein
MTLRDGDFPRWKATSRIEEESMMLAKRGDKPLSYVELLQLTAQNDRLAAERDRLQAQNAQMREELEAAQMRNRHWETYHDEAELRAVQMREALRAATLVMCRDNCDYACNHQEGCDEGKLIKAALSTEPIDYHNPADVKRIAELENVLGIAADRIERELGAASAVMYRAALLGR